MADEYFYKKVNNRTTYYRYDNNNPNGYVRVAKLEINKNILANIKEYDSKIDIIKLTHMNDELVARKERILAELDKVNTKLYEIQTEIDKCGGNYDEEREKIKTRYNNAKQQYGGFHQYYYQYYSQFESKFTKPIDKDLYSNCDTLVKYGILESVNIDKTYEYYQVNYKKAWRLWLLENHPDKGGNLLKCQDVISVGRYFKWCN